MGSLVQQKGESRGRGRLEITSGEVVDIDFHECN